MLLLELILKTRDLSLLLLHQLLETQLELFLVAGFVFGGLDLPLFLFFLKVVYLLLEHLDVQFELLLDLDVISDFGLVLLELCLVLLGRQIDRVERRCELRDGTHAHVKMPVFTPLSIVSRRSVLLLLFKPELHKVLKLGLDICQDSQTRQIPQSAALICPLLWLNHVNLLLTQVQKGIMAD